jgi:hypothetical protein
MSARMSATMAAILGCVILAVDATAAETFKKLTGGEIRAKVSGMEITDEVHSADVFGSGGALTFYAMGRKSTGKWRVERDQLCFDRGKEPGSGCYDVWLAGNKVELKTSGSGLPFEGILRKPIVRR